MAAIIRIGAKKEKNKNLFHKKIEHVKVQAIVDKEAMKELLTLAGWSKRYEAGGKQISVWNPKAE